VARLAVFASGNGGNFEALALALAPTRHEAACLIVDKKNAFALTRAEKLCVPAHYVSYGGRSREEAEEEILTLLAPYKVSHIALAGFMRLLSPRLIDAYPQRIVNIHPALLPKYPGAHGIRDSYLSGNKELGITLHYVDYGLDSGPIILQKSFIRTGKESIEEIESRIHGLEHEFYPQVMLRLLDAEDDKGDV
jgi:phosphoribosylglycinamide formyltransferase-1